MSSYDAIVVGSGPNGLAAAIALARAGGAVIVFEANDTVGGGARSAEMTLPGFLHDVCSAIHPLAAGSPFFRTLPLAEHGLEWIYPPAALAHPFDDGTAAMLEHSIAVTGQSLGVDDEAYNKLMAPLVADWEMLAPELLGPLRFPSHPIALARFGLKAIRSASGFAKRRFVGEPGRGFFAGLAAHSIMPLEHPITAAFGLILGILGHAVGWPMPRGGAQQISQALASYLHSLGGQIITGKRIGSIDELPPARAILLDVTPRQLLRLAAHRLPANYRRRYQWRRSGYSPTARTPGKRASAVWNTGQGPLSLFFVHAAGRRRAWFMWLSRGPRRIERKKIISNIIRLKQRKRHDEGIK